VGSDSETKVGAALRLAPLRRSGPSSGGPGPPAPGAGPRITDAGTGSDICCAMQFWRKPAWTHPRNWRRSGRRGRDLRTPTNLGRSVFWFCKQPGV